MISSTKKIKVLVYLFLICSVSVSFAQDTDNDGVVDAVDLDDDNDGILDTVEGSGNPDGDGLINSLDLDSDGDGLPDNVEAQTTIGYTVPNADDAATYAINNGVNSAYLGGLTPENTDLTDKPDYLDTDSDNDGKSDTVEAGIILSGNDIDNDGLDDGSDEDITGYADPGGTIDNPLSAPIVLPDVDNDATTGGDVDFRDATDDRPDNDNDGIVDALDFDDDNDGILDTDEGLCTTLNYTAGWYNNSPTSTFNQDGYSTNAEADTHIIDGSANDAALISATSPYILGGGLIEVNPPGSGRTVENVEEVNVLNAIDANNYFEYSFTTSAGIPIGTTLGKFAMADSEDKGSYFMAIEFSSDNFTTSERLLTNFEINSIHNRPPFFEIDGISPSSILLPSITYKVRVYIYGATNATTDIYFDDFNIGFCVITDTDSDGVSDQFDLDSDNDGVYDAVEAGHGQAQTNGLVNGAVGTDGVPDTVQNLPNGETVNYTIAESVDDTDTIPDFLDIDSDGDGLSDNVEAQTTVGYTAPSADNAATYITNNGVNLAYLLLGGLNPINTDGIDNPDYLDTDSDNDGKSDTVEAGIILSGNDIDNDGLDDGSDEDITGYADPGGTIDNPLSAPIVLPDVDNDATTGGDVDFRDATDDRPDNDNDGIVDVLDFDDDNDGISDCDESSDSVDSNFFWALNNPSGTLEVDVENDIKITNWALASTGTMTISGLTTSTPTSNLQIDNIPSATLAEAFNNNEYIEVSFVTGNTSTFDLNDIASVWVLPSIGDSFSSTTMYSIGTSTSWVTLSDNLTHTNTSSGAAFFDHLDQSSIPLNANTEYKFRFYIYGQIDDSPQNFSTFDDIQFVIKACLSEDTDADTIPNHLDRDSDNDGIYDAVEAGHGQAQTNGMVNGPVGADGIPDSVQNLPNGETVNYTIAESADDTDTLPNFLDLDSDGDGLPDNVEAQTTVGYTAPSADNAATYITNNGVNLAYLLLGGLNPINTDGIDNPDYLDTDSDNEGGSDTVEAGILLSGNDIDNDGLDDGSDEDLTGYADPGGTIDNPLSAPIVLPDVDNDATTGGDVDFRDATDDRPDNDNDGIVDALDFDDDNDGILDCTEALSNISNGIFGWDMNNPSGTLNMDRDEVNITDWFLASSGTLSVSGVTAIVTTSRYHLTDLTSANLSEAIANDHYVQTSFTTGTGLIDPVIEEIYSGRAQHWRGDSYSMSLSISEDNFATSRLLSQDVLMTSDGSTNNYIQFVMLASPYYLKENTTYTIRTYVYGYVDDTPETYSPWDDLRFTVSACRTVDTDGDNVVDHLDLDSDNDGIYDAVEVGHGQTQTNGLVNGAVGTDGIPDTVQNLPNGETVNYTIAKSADDTDTLPNFLDLDSDGDGLPDNVEAQTTVGYIAPNADNAATYLTNNGVNSAYLLLGGLTPVNTDLTDNPDYLDTDSDNEGGNDTTEAGIALSGNDIDNDGLDDGSDEDITGYADPGGTIDDPLTSPVILPDFDNDATTGGDVDFRDSTDNRPDNDKDGIVDALDFDDDNDGILDTDEGCGNYIINGSFEQQDFTDAITFPNGFTGPRGTFIGATYNTNVLSGWNYTQNLDGWVEGGSFGTSVMADAHHGVQYVDVIGNNNVTGGISNELSQTMNLTIGSDYTLSFYWGEDIGHLVGELVTLELDVIDANGTHIIDETLTMIATGSVNGFVGPKGWFHAARAFTATTSAITIRFSATPPPSQESVGVTIDFVSVTTTSNCQDTDNDGVIDAFDLDSDNDGIYDAVEAGHGQAQTNGLVNGAVGTDGIPDTVQNLPNGETVNYPIAESTDDTDTLPNFLDLDSDGDGIPDNVEAQTTVGYTVPNADDAATYAINNGVNSAYLGGLTPENTDLTDNPDYLDIDSDNEGGNDTTEAGIALSGNDIDNDGLDDGSDEDLTGYADPGGTIDNPLTAPVILPDVDNDATTGGDVNFRDATEDNVDIDSDDDGILDSDEDLNLDADNDPSTNPTDSDGDGYADYLDIDSDQDGIPDNVEAQSTLGYVSPSGLDVNTNGLDDAYETGGALGLFPINTDGDNLPDYLDEDSDNDNVPDRIEGHDHDHDGIADVTLIGSDKDNDGLDDAYEGAIQVDIDVNDEINNPINDLPNTDGDDESDYRDTDDDDDDIDTINEDTNGDGNYANDDENGDGTPDYLEPQLSEDIEIFNVVTPNGDGVHDELTITGLEIFSINAIKIFNRWGVLVYETENYNTQGNSFDGTSQARVTIGQDNRLPVGTYFYIINYGSSTDTMKTKSGHIYLN